MRWPSSRSAMTRNVRPPALACEAGKSDGDLIRQWMNCLFWSIVRCDGGLWSRLGRTTETSDEALDEADAVCSDRTVLLWAIHALGDVSHCVWGTRGGRSIL
jgi:hypothetical protein